MRFPFTILSVLLFSFCFAQNVGIGITTPAAPLHIRNNGSELLRIQGNDPYLSFFNNSGVAKGFVQGLGDNLNLGTSAGNSLGLIQFFNNNNLNMVIHPNSNVGIGTNGPGFKLTVQTGNDNYGIVHRSNDIIVGTWVGFNSGISGGWYGTFTNHPLMFFTNNGGPQITLSQNGNLGIGTIVPQGRLHISGGGNSLHLQGNSSFIYFCDAGNIPKGFVWNKGGNNMDLGTEVGNNSGEVKLTIRGFEALTVQNDGRVRVGTTASIHPVFSGNLPAFTSFGPLCIKDNIFPAANEWSLISFDGTLDFWKNGVTRAYVRDDGEWIVFSDINLKEEVKPYRNVLNQILKLEISTYHYKWSTTGALNFGLVAQNVARYFPEIVSETQNKEGQKILGVSYAKTGVLAIKAIQEQQEIIETQQKKIHELEKRLAILESKSK